jgi:hypothetical protein
MNKNVEKTMSRALSATLALGVVSTAIPVSAKTATSYYNDAKKAVAAAKSKGTQTYVDKASKAIATLKAKTSLDNTAKVKALVSDLNKVQSAVYTKVSSAVSKFKKSQNKADYDAAKKLVDTLKASTSKTVVSKGTSYQKSLDAARATVKSVAAVADKTVALGTTADKLGLSKTINVTLSNGSTTTANVAWDTAKFDGTKAADTTITGKLTVPSTKYYKATTLTASVKVTVSALEVTTVKADTAKSLQVTFNGPVADTSKVTFNVTKGDTTQTAVSGLTTTWNTDKTVATLTQDSNLTATNYTVTVKGDNVSATKNSGTVKVEAQKVAKIEITSKDLIKGTSVNGVVSTASFTYKVTDQYGTDITKTVPSSKISASSVVGSTQITPSLDPAKGIGTIAKTGTGYVDTDKTAVVTLVNSDTGVNATATLDIVAAASVSDFTFGTDKFPTGKTQVETGLSTADTIPVTAKDQYSNTITSASVLNTALNPISSNPNVSFKFDTDSNGNTILNVDTSALTDKATVVLTLVNTTTGKTWSKTFDIVKPAQANSVVVGDFDKTTIAAGDKVALPITVKDQFGNELTKDQIVAQRKTIQGWITGQDSTVTDATGGVHNILSGSSNKIAIDYDKSSKTYGELVFTTNYPGTLAFVFATPGGAQTKTLEVKAARVISSIGKGKDVTLLQGANTGIKFGLVDQYGDTIDNDTVVSGNTATKTSYKVEITKTSGDDNGVSLDSNTTTLTRTYTDAANVGSIKVYSNSTKTGTYKVTLSLLDTTDASNPIEISSASTNVVLSKNNVTGLTYSVADIPTLNGEPNCTADTNFAAGVTLDSTTGNSADEPSAYAQKVKVSAKDASGNDYVINNGDIIDVKSSSANFLTKKDAGTGDWYVVAKRNVPLDNGKDTASTTLTITINTLDGVQKVTKTVLASNKAPIAQKLRVVNSALTDPTTDASGKTDVSYITFGSKAQAIAGTTVNVIALDQYGVWTNVATAPADTITTYVNSTDKAPTGAYKTETAAGATAPKLSLVAGNRALTSTGDLKVTLAKDDAAVQLTVNVENPDVMAATIPTVADHTFQVHEYAIEDTTTNAIAYSIANAHVDMDTATPDIQSSIVIDGETYAIDCSGATPTVTQLPVVGGTIAVAGATVKTITVTDPATGASTTLKLNIAAVTAANTNPSYTITK